MIGFSQTYDGQIISKSNDTTSVKIDIKGGMIFTNNKILSIQNSIFVVSKNTTVEYYPHDIKSFRIRLDGETLLFDSVNDEEFAQRIYSNKVKLYFKLVKEVIAMSPGFRTFRVYMVQKPDGKIKNLIPNGFSRLLTQEEMIRNFDDCLVAFEKVKNDEVKIKNEEKLVDFMKEYEKDCF